MNLLVKILASGLGTGYSPFASGTAGSALAALIYWVCFPRSQWIALGIILAVLILSIPVSTAAEKLYGKKDDSHIVIDEVIGMWLSVIFMPHSLKLLLAAFVIFRIMDVIKPFFIRDTQRLPGGWGIVADDFFAGIATNLMIQAARYLLSWM
jgi:phosphatidylglycerophosphatase A